MKTKNLLSTLFASFLVVTNLSAQNPTFEWARQMGGTGSAQPHSIATDISGNVYTTGWFDGSADFDPGAGTTNLISQGSRDIYIQKLDANGNLLWVKQMGGSGADNGVSISTDANGNVYTMGGFNGTVDFNPGAGITNLTSNGRTDIFIQKLDAGGNFLWVKQLGGTGYDGGNSSTSDAIGNVYTTGYFNGVVDFDPGTGITNLTSNGLEDIFIQKLDANGNLLWVSQMGSIQNEIGRSVAIDANSNVYTTGWFQGTVDFDPGAGTSNLTSNGAGDIFIQKLDAAGNFLWVKQTGGIGNDYGESNTTDINGNIYTTGLFSDIVDFDPGAGITNLTSNGSTNVFIQKLDADGNFLWAKQIGGTNNQFATAITTDANSNLYVTGYFGGTVDFDPGAGTLIFNTSSIYNDFIQKLDAAGNLNWAKQMGGAGIDQAFSITTDANGNVYTTGWFQGTVDFDPGAGTTNLTSKGTNDIFIQKLSQTTTGSLENSLSENYVVYPNPASSEIQIRNKNAKGEFKIYDIHGKIMLTETITSLNQTIDIRQLKPGIYIWKMENRKGKLAVQ